MLKIMSHFWPLIRHYWRHDIVDAALLITKRPAMITPVLRHMLRHYIHYAIAGHIIAGVSYAIDERCCCRDIRLLPLSYAILRCRR